MILLKKLSHRGPRKFRSRSLSNEQQNQDLNQVCVVSEPELLMISFDIWEEFLMTREAADGITL